MIKTFDKINLFYPIIHKGFKYKKEKKIELIFLKRKIN
jgi:hypothetical protein